jgi:hypothetical protein
MDLVILGEGFPLVFILGLTSVDPVIIIVII